MMTKMSLRMFFSVIILLSVSLSPLVAAVNPLTASGTAGDTTLRNSSQGTPPADAVADPEIDISRLSPVPQSVNGCASPVLDLGGTWKFNPAPPAGFQSSPAGAEAAGWADIKVPGEWAMQGFDVKPGTAAAYLRTFTLPNDWAEKCVKLRCDAVYSDATVFINGKLAGRHIGGFTPFEFDITGLLNNAGENVIALSVLNESPADTLASGTKYACHQLGGIPRRIRLLALPETNIASLQMTTSLDASYRNAMLNLSLEAAVEGSKSAGPLEALLELRTPEGSLLPIAPAKFPIESLKGRVMIPIENPLKWDNEHPRLYTLTITLLENGKAVETLSQRVGFRQVEVKGNQVLVNGSAVKLRGVNHHEVYPLTGRSVPDALHRLDVGLFREGNVNLLRTCHYPPDEALLIAADELGMFVECEAPFCWAPGSGHTELVSRATAEMVLACRNHPSVLFWSLANESKWGDDFMASSRLVRKLDPTRPQTFNWMTSKIQTVEEGFTDIANIHYPAHGGPAQTRKYTKRPVYLGEDCHLNAYNRLELATDPALRDLWGRYTREMWDDLYETNGSLGQSIWAGIDDTFYMKDDRTVGYGTWGPLDGWRRMKPEYWGMKKAYSPVRLDEKSGFKTKPDGGIEIPVVNRNNFSNLGEMKIDWRLGAQSGSVKADIPPRSTGTIRIKTEHKAGQADQLELIFTDPRGFVADQFLIPPLSNTRVAGQGVTAGTPCVLKESEGTLTVTSGRSQWCIDKKSGLLVSANKLPVSGPELMLLPMNKDGETQMTGKTKVWEPFTAPCSGWTCTKVASSLENGTVTVSVKGKYDNAEGGFLYTFAPGGDLSVAYHFTLTKDVNPRQIGLVFGLPRDCETLSWERNGYWNVYPEDHIARLKGTVRASEGFDATSVGPRTKPSHPWRLDNLPYGNNDFCSTKHNILVATVSDGNGNGLMIDGAGRQHVRCWRKENNVFFLVADYSNGGSERFLRGHSGKDDRPLKAGDKVSGSVTLRIPEAMEKAMNPSSQSS